MTALASTLSAPLDAVAAPATTSQFSPYTHFLEVLSRDNRIFCAKSHRVDLPGQLPLIPCLDHEAQLQGQADPHISVYIEDAEGDMHEVGIVPTAKRIIVDAGSALAETSPAARQRLSKRLRVLFPQYKVVIKRPSIVRGDRRVAEVVRAQVRLRDILRGEDSGTLRWQLEKLRAIADLMEKEARVYSWGVRTMTPAIGGAGVVTFMMIGMVKSMIPIVEAELLRSATVTVLTGGFLYYGLKAVYLTELGTRVWKRATEYKLILEARERAVAAKRAEG